jgi:uncharacterized protein (DUF3084 family)
MARPDLQVMGRTVPRIRPEGAGKFHLKVRSLTTLAAKEPKARKVGASDKLQLNTVSGSDAASGVHFDCCQWPRQASSPDSAAKSLSDPKVTGPGRKMEAAS